jgi:hypothetical protein
MRDFLRTNHSAFDPKKVQLMTDAFDAAWLIIRPKANMTDQSLEELRLALAKRIVELVSHGDYDVQTLRDTAIASMTSPAPDLIRKA